MEKKSGHKLPGPYDEAAMYWMHLQDLEQGVSIKRVSPTPQAPIQAQ